MLVGLRKSWGSGGLQEEPAEYGCQPDPKAKHWLLGHERLEVYQVGLEFMGWFHGLPAGAELTNRLYRQVDKAATSVVLNIAEGNGRLPPGDRGKFLDTAQAMSVKAAAYLDLCERNAELDNRHRAQGTGLLARVALMLRALSRAQEAQAG